MGRSDGAEFDFFGVLVSVSGDTAVIGAWRDDDNGSDSGSVYVFRFDGSGWVQEAKILPSDGEPSPSQIRHRQSSSMGRGVRRF